MPTTRRRRRQEVREPLSPALEHFLRKGRYDDLPDEDQWDVLTSKARLRATWIEYGDDIIAAWIAEHPGSRPHAWWKYGAPERERRRLGGIGTPAHEVLAYVPAYDYGIPVHWITAWDVAYYTGHARDIHGRPIGTEYRARPFRGVAIDPRDPPTYESQAAYLRRHGLLGREEAGRLTTEDFGLEIVTPADSDDPDDEEERQWPA